MMRFPEFEPILQLAALDRVLRPAREPTPAGFRAMHDALNGWHHADVLRSLFEIGAHPRVCQVALVLCWRSTLCSRGVAEAARDRATLARWFMTARFDWPLDGMMNEIFTTWIPRETVLFRGGRGDPVQLSKQYSWTPVRAVAAIFGCANPSPHPATDGPPVIIRRTVRREEVALAFLIADAEHVVLEEGPFEVDTTDPDELSDLMVQGREMQVRHRAEHAEFVARWQRFLAESAGSAR